MEIAVFLAFFAVEGEFAPDVAGAAIAALSAALVLSPYVLAGSAVALALLLRSAQCSGAPPSRARAVVLGLLASAPLALVLFLWLGPAAVAWTLAGGLVYGTVVRLPQRR